MKPSEMLLDPDETTQHVITTHAGKEVAGEPCWTEAGVVRWLVDGNPTDINYFTYDNDEGQWKFHGTTDSSSKTSYVIFVSNEVDAWGYVYDIWIDGQWVRSGHLGHQENNVDQANEIWSDTGVYTDDEGIAKHENSKLHVQDFSVWWDEQVDTEWWEAPQGSCPIYESHSIEGDAYAYYTWVD
ncbi:MAG: hypothetical protein ACOC5C_04600 [Halobacteriota archaeon]